SARNSIMPRETFLAPATLPLASTSGASRTSTISTSPLAIIACASATVSLGTAALAASIISLIVAAMGVSLNKVVTDFYQIVTALACAGCSQSRTRLRYRRTGTVPRVRIAMPRGLNVLTGSCPWPGPWSGSHGAHLQLQAREDPIPTVCLVPSTLTLRVAGACAAEMSFYNQLLPCFLDAGLRGPKATRKLWTT